MQPSRRRLLWLSSASALGCFLPPATEGTQVPTPRRRRSNDPPSASESDDSPGSPNARNPTKTILEERQKNIKKEVEKLYDLAAELKSEVEKTDSTSVLSLAMLKKADEIEKLAKQIKDHAKG